MTCSGLNGCVPLPAFLKLPYLESVMSADLEHIRQIMREADCLYTEAEVDAAIARVGAQINAELAERNPVVF
ncbi:Hypoxanthine-guanine phosphoribosyltransferase, partial [Pseudomonas savastanoi pv. glycinea]